MWVRNINSINTDTVLGQIIEALGDKVGTSFKMVVKRSHGEQVTLHVVAEEASPDI
jgi:HtrA serine peptidase 2